MLPQKGAVLEVVATEAGAVADARLEAVSTTASLSKAGKSVCGCREYGVCAAELANWRAGSTAGLAQLEQTRGSPRAAHAHRKRIKSFDREMQRNA